MQLRDYQSECIESIWNYFRSKQGNPLCALPTGTGKSVIIAGFLQSVFRLYPMQRILILTHVKEIISQNYSKLMALWSFAPAGIYSAGLNRKDLNSPITFAGIASVAKKWAAFGHVDLVLIDEAHLLSPNDQTMYRTFLQGLKSINPLLKVIGFTATPWRLGHGHLIDPYEDSKGNLCDPLFTDMCFDITNREAFNRLIAEGYLLPLVPKRPKLQLDTDGLHMRGGEFIEKEMQERFDRDEITEAALREAMEYGHDRRKWLIFASGTDHADHIGDMLNMMGIPTGVVHSKREGRDQTIADFKAGKIRAVVNNNVLTTGFDEPEIDLIIFLRATLSAPLWVQALGRGTRPFYAPGYDINTTEGRLAAIAASPKQNCLVLDYARNTSKLGPINDPVIPRKRGQKGGEAPVKLCERCETWNHASVRFCTECNFEFSFETKFKEQAATDELIKGDLPKVEVFPVDHISIDKHEKELRPPMMKVSYYCRYKVFSEYICIEHKDFAGRKARKWWQERSSVDMPATTDEAIALCNTLRPPTHLRVWTNKKYPEILAFCYDGTAFGTEEADESRPEIENRVAKLVEQDEKVRLQTAEWDDDDVPF